MKQGVRICGETINALRFAVDIAFCAETKGDLQNILSNVSLLF